MQSTNDQLFAASYTACDPLSCYHDLKCGHRIHAAYATEDCGINCKRPMADKPFVYPDCLVADVRLEMTFESLDVSSTGSDANMEGMSREARIQKIADTELQKLLAQGCRLCKIAPKFVDPKLQFWHQFLVEEGYEGIAADANAVLSPTIRHIRLVETDPTADVWAPRDSATKDAEEEADVPFTFADIEQEWNKFSRQFQSRNALPCPAQPVVDYALDGLLENFLASRIGLAVEDEATRAVREAFNLCALTASSH